MCLGLKKTILTNKAKIFKGCSFNDRHRHRLEVNPQYVPLLEEKGMNFVGIKSDRSLKGNIGYEIFELEGNLFHVGFQSHPEFTSRPLDPHPAFTKFVEAIIQRGG